MEDPPSPLRFIGPLGFPEPSGAAAHRTSRFERRGGLRVINDRTRDHDRDDATSVMDTVEIWDLINKSGGWLHPIHIHEEYHVTDSLPDACTASGPLGTARPPCTSRPDPGTEDLEGSWSEQPQLPSPSC